MNSVVDRITEVLEQHYVSRVHTVTLQCKCGERFAAGEDHRTHVAAAVQAALGLEQQWGVVIEDGFGDTPDDYADDEQHALEIAADRCTSCDHCRGALPKRVVSRWNTPWLPSQSGDTE